MKYRYIKSLVIFFLIQTFAFELKVFPQNSSKNVNEKIVGGITLVLVPEGSFVMGRNISGEDFSPAREVTITKPFWIGKYEITQKQYYEITGSNPCEGSKYGYGDNLPVYNVSWYDAVVFCNMLSERCGLKPYYKITESEDKDNISQYDFLKWTVKVNKNANGFRLPTEAQWEYAAASGSQKKFFWGDNSSWDVAGVYSWHLFNSGVRSYSKGRFWWVKYHTVKPVGKKKPNSFGIYDICGNVAEWCFDRYDYNYYSLQENIDPQGWSGEYKYRVIRGGDILNAPQELETFRRSQAGAFEKTGLNGIRVVLPAE